ncbi:MAG TPA: chorismate-binding protein [Acidimicrobiales bacterium]|nr:chorismate-binding protein [Acidimicrobiales bacterium]
MTAPLAVVGGMLLTGLRDVTRDPSALDGGAGVWAVVAGFEGDIVCARFDDVRPATPWPGAAWRGPARNAWTSSLDEASFKKGVQTIRDAIGCGDVYQVNLCRVLSAPVAADADVAARGAALAEGNPAPFAAVVRLPEQNVHVASASPERFVRRAGDVVVSQPIKGTAATIDGFLAKDYAENVMIVDLVRNDLGRCCEFGSVEVPALCAVEPHPGLFHLVSTVRGRLRAGYGWSDVLAATFPPGSVTGAPKLAALDMIRALEPVARGPYCGAIGWVDAGRNVGDLNVGIRTFWLADGRIHFGTGGGITWDSTAEGEWEETELKARRLLSVASSS